MTDLHDALRRAEDPSAPWPARAAAARRVAAAAPGAHDGRLDALQAAFLDPAIARQIPVGLRVAFWTAVGDRNLVARAHARWISVPAGPSWVGPVPGDPHTRDREGPGQLVELPAFRIQAWPVTVAEYALFLADDPARAADPRRSPLAHAPATWVTPADADAYCAWLAQRTGHPVALPTEAQWTFAARGPHANGQPIRRYPWGQDADPERHRDAQRAPLPPGAFPGGVSWCGTWEQAGNVWEWCRGAYHLDPTAELTDAGARRPLRGGSYTCEAQFLRISHRASAGADERFADVGFRCVVG